MSDDARRLWQAPEVPDRAPAPDRPPPPVAPPADRPPRDDRPDLPFWWIGFAGLAVALVLVGIVFAILARLLGDPDASEPSTVLSANGVQGVMFVAIAFAAARIGTSGSLRVALGLRRPERPGAAAGLAVLAMLAFLVIGNVYARLAGIDGNASEATVDALGMRDSTLLLILGGVLVGVVAPIGEEIFFRGLVFGALWRRFGWVLGAFASGVTFGLLHAGGAIAEALPILVVFGFVLAWAYRQTGSLATPVAMHTLNNAVTFTSISTFSAGVETGIVLGLLVFNVGLVLAVSAPARSVLRTP